MRLPPPNNRIELLVKLLEHQGVHVKSVTPWREHEDGAVFIGSYRPVHISVGYDYTSVVRELENGKLQFHDVKSIAEAIKLALRFTEVPA